MRDDERRALHREPEEGEPAAAEIVRGLPEHIGRRAPAYPCRPITKPSMRGGDRFAALTPEILLDGITAGRLTAQGVSVRGDFHRWEGACRQDAMAIAHVGKPDASMLVLAVADGVGSSKRSHSASQDAAHLIAAHLDFASEPLHRGLLDQDEAGLGALAEGVVARTVAELRRRWQQDAGAQYDEGDYATTLHVLLVPADDSVRHRFLISVGDGGLCVLRDGAWAVPAPAPGPVLDMGTAALPLSCDAVVTRIVAAEPGDVLLLGTDGMTAPLAQEREFAARLAGYWGGGDVPAASDFLWQAQLRARTYDDDRTVVCLWDGGAAR